MIIKRTELFEDAKIIDYLQPDGFWGKKETARIFDSREYAENYIEDEKCDPLYEKEWKGECIFDIEEVTL